MQISSYTFQSPYPQPFQVGRPDPSTAKEEQSSETISNQNEKQAIEGKLSRTKESDVNTSIDALQKGMKPDSAKQFNSLSVPVGFGINIPMGAVLEGNSQNGVSSFKSLSASVQGQKAYAQEAVS